MRPQVAQTLDYIRETELPFARLPSDSPRSPEGSATLEFAWVPVDSFPPELENESHFFVAGLAGLVCRHTSREEFAVDVDISLSGPRRAQIAGLSLDTTGDDLSQLVAEALRSARPAERRQSAAPLGVTFLTPDGDDDLEGELRRFAVGRELVLGVSKRDEQLSVAVAYDGRLFRRTTAIRVAGHVLHLAAQIQKNAAAPLSSYPLLTDRERKEQETWRSREIAYPTTPVHVRFEENADKTPDAIAVEDDNGRLTYRELNERAHAIARCLSARGLTVGDRVVVCLEQSTDVVAAMLGIFKAGATYVPVAPEYPPDRLQVMLEDTRPVAIITRGGANANLPSTDAALIDLGVDISLAVESSAVEENSLPSSRSKLSDVAYIIYTSGTTGTPKGVMISHGNLIQYLHSACERFGFHSGDCFSAVARATFSISFFELLIPLWMGGKVRIIPREHLLDFRRFVGTMSELTVMHLSPSLLRQLVAYLATVDASNEKVASLRHVSSGGDVVPPDLQEGLKRTFPRAELFVIYGCSEISCMGSTYEIPRDSVVTRSYVGKAFDNVRVDVLDSHLSGCPVGVGGEICFSGAGVGLGYFNRPELTAERFIEHDGRRIYRTGDVGRFDESGNVEIMGRSDFQVKVRGIRIEPGEVEYAIRGLSGVRDTVVVCKKLASGEDGLVAYLVLESSAPAISELRRTLESKLPDYMVPSVFVTLKALPVNINNKLDRRALPDPTASDYLSLRSHTPPRTETEKQLVAFWERLLEIHPIGIDERFFDLGGTSLLVLTMMVGIEKDLGVTLPLSALLVAPTIRELASRIDAGGNSTGTDPVLLRPGTDKLPLFFVHDGDGEVMPYHGLSQQIRPGHPIYGLPPIGRDGHVMSQTRLTEVAEAYIRSVKKIQPQGPYLLGGLCIGGFVAFEMARQLKAQGDVVGLLTLMDAAFANATHKSVAKRRMDHFQSVLGNTRSGSSTVKGTLRVVQEASTRIKNVVSYEAKTRSERTLKRAKIHALRYALDRDLSIPPLARGLTVDDILRFAEHEYKTPPVYDGCVYLLLATKTDPTLEESGINDTPYQEIFEQKHLGWDGKAKDLRVREVSGGHSSMLQSPNVLEIAAIIHEQLDQLEGASH